MKKRLTLVRAAVLILSCVFAFGGCGKEDELLPKESNEAVVEIETDSPIETEEPTAEPTGEPEAIAELSEEPTKEPEVTVEPEVAQEPTREPVVTQSPVVTIAPTQAPVVTTAPTQATVVTAAPTTAPTAAPVVTEASVAHTHTWDGSTITIAATCSTSGEMKYTCSGCGETKTETIAPNENHEKVDVWELGQVPDCRHPGTLITKCANCGFYFERTDYDSTEHNWEYTITFAGNCRAAAAYSRVCKDCGIEGTTTYGDLSLDVHNFKTYTDEVWNEETWVWETVTSTCCSDCGKLKE